VPIPGKDVTARLILRAFEQIEYPGDAFLLGSRKRCAPSMRFCLFRVKQVGARCRPSIWLYGAATFLDYAPHRMWIFTREEAQANVAYLECK
jgi:hypothetical protein